MSVTELRTLGEEPFGHRLYRARKASGVELRDAATTISRLMFTSHTTLHRLEKLAEVPENRQRRALAFLALLVYGFDPAPFGLSEDDLPKGIRADALSELTGASTGWLTRCSAQAA